LAREALRAVDKADSQVDRPPWKEAAEAEAEAPPSPLPHPPTILPPVPRGHPTLSGTLAVSKLWLPLLREEALRALALAALPNVLPRLNLAVHPRRWEQGGPVR